MAVNCTCQVTLNLKNVNSLSLTQALYSTYFSVLLINASNFLTTRKKKLMLVSVMNFGQIQKVRFIVPLKLQTSNCVVDYSILNLFI